MASRVQTQPSARRIRTTVAVGTTVVVGGACVLLLFALFRDWRRHGTRPCANPSCEEFAKLIADSINRSVNPCDNFDAYVCGGWRSRQAYSVYAQLIANAVDKMTNVVSKGAKPPATGQSILQKASLFYRSCDMVWRGDRDEVPVIRECFRRAGIVWPRRSPAPNVLRTLFSLSIEFDWAVVINVVPAQQSLWILVPYSFVLAAEEQERWQELYSRRRTFELIKAHFSDGAGDAAVQFEEVNNLEEAFFIPLDKARINSEVPTMPSANLEEDKWITLIAEFNVTGVSKLKSFNKHYLMTFVDLWKKLGEDKTHAFISWMAARYASLFANHELVSNYYSTTNDDLIKYEHGHWCYELAYEFFGDILFAPHNDLVFEVDVRRDVERIAFNIRKEFHARLLNKMPYSADIPKEVQWSSLEKAFGALYATAHQEGNSAIALNSLIPDMNLSFTRNWEAAWRKTRFANITAPRMFGWHAVHLFLPYTLRHGDFVLAPYLLLFPLYDLNVVDAVKYGAFGGHVAKASADLSLNHFANSSVTAYAVEAGLDCVSRYNITRAALDTLSDLASLEVLVEVFAEHGSQWRLAGLSNLTATQLLFIVWCYMRCRGHSEPLGDDCNAAIQQVAAFSSAFTCVSAEPANLEKKCSLF